MKSNLLSWIDPRAHLVRVGAFKSYLLKKDWILDPRSNDRLLFFTGPRDEDGVAIVLTIPAAEKFRDYYPIVVDRIGALGLIEDRYARDVLDDILKEGEALVAVPANGAQTSQPAKRLRGKQRKTK
jgi:hypothetical protein